MFVGSTQLVGLPTDLYSCAIEKNSILEIVARTVFLTRVCFHV